MTSKERMLIALAGGKPDRLPVTIHQWQPYHLKQYMNGMNDIEANAAVGLDASINYFELEPGSENSAGWRVETKVIPKGGEEVLEHTIYTPEKQLRYTQGRNPMTTWVNEHLVKEPEDIYQIKKYRPIPRFNRKGAVETYDKLGDGGILRTFIFGFQGGCWQDACELFGVENLIMATFDDPDWVHEFLQILLQQKLDYISENLSNLPFDLIETGGGASSNTVISPAIHEEFCLPYDTAIHKALKSLGFKTTYHTCGGMTKIAHLIVQNQCDVSETLSPTGVGGDIDTDEAAAGLYRALHPKVALIGGMDQYNILEKGSKQQIEQEVQRLFRIYGADGGYILSACDHFFSVPPENLIIFSDAAKQCVYGGG